MSSQQAQHAPSMVRPEIRVSPPILVGKGTTPSCTSLFAQSMMGLLALKSTCAILFDKQALE